MFVPDTTSIRELVNQVILEELPRKEQNVEEKLIG